MWGKIGLVETTNGIYGVELIKAIEVLILKPI
jgi:hypothetical protein